jgi:N-formylglutamate deformylase
MEPFTLSRPGANAVPIVVDSPHSGTDYPADFGSVLQRAWRCAAARTPGCTSSVCRRARSMARRCWRPTFPRAYIDPNRSLPTSTRLCWPLPWPGPVAPGPKTELGIGLVWRLMDGRPIYDRRLGVGRTAVTHRPLLAPVPRGAGVGAGGVGVAAALAPERAFDARRGLPPAGPAREAAGRRGAGQPRRQHLRRGDDGAGRARVFRSAGYSVARNDPFKGVEIIRSSGQPARLACGADRGQALALHGRRAAAERRVSSACSKACDTMLAALAAEARRQLAG